MIGHERSVLMLVTCLAATAIAQAAEAAVLFSDGFEDLSQTETQLNYTAFLKWDVGMGGQVDLVKSGEFGIDCPKNNGFCVDLVGSPDPGRIETKQAFSLTPGIYYHLSFEISGSQRLPATDTITVSLGTLYQQTFERSHDSAFAVIDVIIPVASAVSATLVFETSNSDPSDSQGIMLDNVRLAELDCDSIAVSNPGFEDPLLSGDSYTTDIDCDPGDSSAIPLADPIPNWTLVPPMSDGGILNPTSGSFTSGAPQGENVAYGNKWSLQCNVRPTITQTLTETLETGHQYLLQVEVGDRKNRTFAPYRVDLLAGGVVVASDLGTETVPNDGFITSTVIFNAPVGHPQIGQQLGIALASLGEEGQTIFDDVRLCKISAPTQVAATCSHFDAGSEGWELTEASNGSLTYMASGGNPDGYIEFGDMDTGRAFVQAPSAFTGDMSQLDGDVLSFDYRVLDPGDSMGNPPPGTPSYLGFEIRLIGFGGGVDAEIRLPKLTDPPMDQGWQAISAPLVASAWDIQGGTWAQLLSNVATMEISIENVANDVPGETAGLDNICLAESPSLPAIGPVPLSVLVLTIAALGVARIRRALREI